MVFIKEKLQAEHLPFQLLAKDEFKPNMVAELSGENGGPELLLHAHLDTVPAGELSDWKVNPFSGECREGKIFGRGAGDDKASVAAQVMAMVALARNRFRPKGKLTLAIVSDEESGGLVGTKWLREEGLLQPDVLVVGEQTKNHIAIAERVACGIDIIFRGRSAHGATPWEGENAILHAAQALCHLQVHLVPRLKEKSQHFYLPPSTLNIGRIEGGMMWNTVPEYCRVEMDRRLLPGESREEAMQEVRDVLDHYSERFKSLDYELISEGEVAANIDTPSDDPFVRIAQGCLEDLTQETRPLTGYVQTSDGRWFAGDGIPIIIFGPGDPALAHASNEYVEVSELVEASRFLALLAMRFLS